MNITIVTPSIPKRAAMLGECVQSVAAQTDKPRRHIIEVDWSREGFVNLTNQLITQVESEWLMVLPDDDLIDPNHLEAISAVDDDGADIIYSWCRVVGRDDWSCNAEFNAERLRWGNYIPGGAAAMRTKTFREFGGYRHEASEDWGLWLRALGGGARFKCVPEVTWTYRFHDGGNLSLDTLVGGVK